MSFDKVAIKRNKSRWAGIFGQQRTMSNGRLVGTAFTLFLAITLVFSCIFYLPAFFDYRTAFQLKPQDIEDRRFAELEALKPKRTYFRAGQGLRTVYKFPSGAKAELVYYKCKPVPILEVFRCDPQEVERQRLRRTNGQHRIRINQSGFYGVQVITSAEDYDVIWQRTY